MRHRYAWALAVVKSADRALPLVIVLLEASAIIRCPPAQVSYPQLLLLVGPLATTWPSSQVADRTRMFRRVAFWSPPMGVG